MSSSASSPSPLSSAAASSLTILTANQSDDLVAGEESAVRAWLMSQGFRSGEIRLEKLFHDTNEKYMDASVSIWMHPMARGCYKGELNVCKWLHDSAFFLIQCLQRLLELTDISHPTTHLHAREPTHALQHCTMQTRQEAARTWMDMLLASR